MITVSDLSFNFGTQTLFKGVDLKFTPGNCYGIIGANGAGKSTFLKILCGELEPSHGSVIIPPTVRMSVLRQDHYAFDEYTVLDTVIMGNRRLYDIMKEKDALYETPDFSEADGMRAAVLEEEFAELDGWEAESDASKLIQGLGLEESLLYEQMASLSGSQKVKVLLAQALFGNPDIILLDEPTNDLDIAAVKWLEDFLSEYFGTVIVVSHDRHFLNNVCTRIVDIDYSEIKMYVGNYEFWYESSQLIQKLIKQQNKKNEEKAKELQAFIARFSANKSKSRQATSRKKLLDKLTIEELPASSRRYPFVGFDMDREVGKDILTVEGLTKEVDGVKLLNNVSFTVRKNDKIAFVGKSEQAITMLFKILMEEETPDSARVKWDVYKPVKVLSGGEKVRCMLSRMMLFGSNVLILDQPTNHLDLESITAVNNGLSDFKGNVLFCSHDYEIVNTVAIRIIEICDDGVIDHSGNYDDFVEFKESRGMEVTTL